MEWMLPCSLNLTQTPIAPSPSVKIRQIRVLCLDVDATLMELAPPFLPCYNDFYCSVIDAKVLYMNSILSNLSML